MCIPIVGGDFPALSPVIGVSSHVFVTAEEEGRGEEGQIVIRLAPLTPALLLHSQVCAENRVTSAGEGAEFDQHRRLRCTLLA